MEGNLAFRVDNYEADCRGEVVLMDAVGKPLLTARRKVTNYYRNKYLVIFFFFFKLLKKVFRQSKI